MLERQRRLVALTMLARLRWLSWPPWLLLLLWLAWAAGQEPVLLRAHDTYLLEGAAWWGVSALAIVWVAAESAHRAGPTVQMVCDLGAAVLAGLLWLLLVASVDWVSGRSSERYLQLAICLPLCLGSVAAAVGALQTGPQTVYRYAVMTISALLFATVSVRLASALEWQAVVAAAMATAASLAAGPLDPLNTLERNK
jgi:hypothetical protein